MRSISTLIQLKPRLHYYLLLLLFLLVSCRAVMAGNETGLFDKGIFFRIEKPQFPASYVMGTVHSSDARVLQLSPQVKSALSSSGQFVMEVALNEGSVLSSLGNLWLLDGRQLSQVIGDDLYTQVIEAGNQAGLPASTFTYMKPWIVMIMFSLPPGDYASILDLELMKRALKQNKPIIGLETAREQFDVFDGLPVEEQKRLLAITLKNYPELPKQFEKLLQAYLQRDLAKLQEAGREQVEPADLVLYERLLIRLVDERNRRMVTRLLPRLADDSSFVAVGALHLPGENGILNLLQQQGFSVMRVE